MQLENFFTIVAVVVVIAVIIPFYRVIVGPTIFDRLLAASAMGSKTIVLICVFGIIYQRESMFIDIALAYAILNFMSGIAVAKFFKGNR